MGRDLIFTHSAFYRSLSKADEILKSLGSPWSLIEELVQNEAQSRVNQSDIAQPTTTAIQIALVDMLESLGITPAAVVGHSSGEIAAGYVSRPGLLVQLDHGLKFSRELGQLQMLFACWIKMPASNTLFRIGELVD